MKRLVLILLALASLLCAMSSPLFRMAVAAQSPDLSRHFRKKKRNSIKQFNNYQLWQM